MSIARFQRGRSIVFVQLCSFYRAAIGLRMANKDQLLKTIEELQAEKARIERALVELEALARGSDARRPVTKAKKAWSQTQRTEQAKRMRAYWAEKKRRNVR